MEEIRKKELLWKISQGEEGAFETLYEETRKDIFAFALSILNDYHDAEDVMQEVFLKIKLKAGVCKDFDNTAGWMIRITKNTALDLIRKKKRAVIDEDLVKNSVHTKEESGIAECSIFISELFAELGDEERQIVVLHLLSDLTHKTIAKTLNLPLTTVKWRYRKAILHLEKVSKKKGWEL